MKVELNLFFRGRPSAGWNLVKPRRVLSPEMPAFAGMTENGIGVVPSC